MGLLNPGMWGTPPFRTVCPSGASARAVVSEQPCSAPKKTTARRRGVTHLEGRFMEFLGRKSGISEIVS
jgi:hypothetical protein